MKKILVSILISAFILTIATSVFAVGLTSTSSTGNVTVSFVEDSTYYITLPTDTALSKTTVGESTTYVGNGTISINSSNFKIASTETLKVSVNGGLNYSDGFRMKSSNNTDYASYTIKAGSTPVSQNDIVAEFTMAAHENVNIEFSASVPTYSGTYSDTLTFTVAVG